MRSIFIYILRIAIVRTNEYNRGVKALVRKENTMAKTANLYARIEPDVKAQAEDILAALGIPVSNAINMFYKQISLQRGIPFELKLPSPNVPDMSKMTQEDLDRELEKGWQDVLDGRTVPAEKVFSEAALDKTE